MANPAPSFPDRDPYADRRLHQRVEVALPAFLQVDLERHFVQVVDVSNGGARLTSSEQFPAGTEVILDCGTLSRSAVVRWQNAEFLGLSFDSELEDREVKAIIVRSHALTDRINAQG